MTKIVKANNYSCATNLSCKIFQKTFKNKVSKTAYMEAMKWLAKNVYSKDELSENISVKIQKDKKSKIPTFIVTLFMDVDFEGLHSNFCEQCKRVYNSFYQVEKMNCYECKANAEKKTNDKYCKGLISIYKKIFEEIENENNKEDDE
jgi:hypothetical protein